MSALHNQLLRMERAEAARPTGIAIRAIIAGFAPLLVLYALYTLVRWTFVDRATTVGDHNALSVMRLQERLGLDWEQSIQGFILQRSETIWFVNHYYVYAFFPVLIGSAAISALKSPAAFQLWRSIFAVSLAMALIGFAFFPLTPPRLLASDSGFIDTLMIAGPRYYGDESGSSLFNAYGSIPSIVNEYAAMPSMHVGWSAVAAALLVSAFPRNRWLLALGIAHVTMMQISVVGTGNHYMIDGIIGLLVVLASWIVVTRLAPRLKAAFQTHAVAARELTVCHK